MDTPIDVVAGGLLDGRYEVLERMKPGTMAFVVRARDRELDEEVACKIPLDTSAYKAGALMAQYNKLRRLNSRHLPALWGLARHRTSEPQFLFVVMELVAGVELEEWHPGKPLRKRIEVLASVAETLAALGTAHGDLDSRNILVSHSDRVVLIDPDAEEFGSSRSGEARSGRAGDLVGLRAVIEECTSEDERRGLDIMLRRFDSSDSQRLSATEIGAALQHLLSFQLLPGENSASLTELASSYQRRTDDTKTVSRRIIQLRDLAFRNTEDLLRRVAARVGLQVPNRDDVPVSDAEFLRREFESGPPAKGNLNDRLLLIRAQEGDQIWFEFFGENRFRWPWPVAARPGLLARGILNVQRETKAIALHDLELHEIRGTPVLSVVEPGRVRVLDEAVVERAFRVLLEFVFPALAKPYVRSDGIATDPGNPIIGWEFLVPSCELLGVRRPSSPVEYLRAATETAMRLARESKTGNGIWGSRIHEFFTVPADYDSRLDLLTGAVAAFLEKCGHFFSVIYRFDVRVLDEARHRLRIELDGEIHGQESVEWRFEFSADPD